MAEYSTESKTEAHTVDESDVNEPLVMSTIHADSAEFTVSIDEEDHRFEAWTEGGTAYIEYVETLSWRGQIRVASPEEEVWQTLLTDDTFQRFVSGANRVRRVGTSRHPNGG